MLPVLWLARRIEILRFTLTLALSHRGRWDAPAPPPRAYPAHLLRSCAPLSILERGMRRVLPLDVHGHYYVGEAGVAGVAEDGWAGWGGY